MTSQQESQKVFGQRDCWDLAKSSAISPAKNLPRFSPRFLPRSHWDLGEISVKILLGYRHKYKFENFKRELLMISYYIFLLLLYFFSSLKIMFPITMQNVDWIVKGFAVLQVVINPIDAPESSKKWCWDHNYHLELQNKESKLEHGSPSLGRIQDLVKGVQRIVCQRQIFKRGLGACTQLWDLGFRSSEMWFPALRDDCWLCNIFEIISVLSYLNKGYT